MEREELVEWKIRSEEYINMRGVIMEEKKK